MALYRWHGSGNRVPAEVTGSAIVNVDDQTLPVDTGIREASLQMRTRVSIPGDSGNTRSVRIDRHRGIAVAVPGRG